jgi:hypothetical protein
MQKVSVCMLNFAIDSYAKVLLDVSGLEPNGAHSARKAVLLIHI